jgi:hypothetical protein
MGGRLSWSFRGKNRRCGKLSGSLYKRMQRGLGLQIPGNILSGSDWRL